MNSAKKTEPMSPAPRRRRNRRSERERDDLSEGGSLAEEKDVAGVRAAAEEDEREPELVLRFTVVPAEVKLTLCKSSARSSTHGSISDPINEEIERERCGNGEEKKLVVRFCREIESLEDTKTMCMAMAKAVI